MDLGENEDGNDFYGDFNDYVDHDNRYGKNETNEEIHSNAIFEKINEEKNKPQTEFSKKPNQKKQIKHKNSLAENSSNILQKKTNRDDESTKKKKKTKNDMELTLKNKTEIDYNKEDREKQFYDMFNQEEAYLDFYDQPAGTGDLANLMNSDEAIPDPEVNQTRQIYTTQNNFDVQETFNMVLSSRK